MSDWPSDYARNREQRRVQSAWTGAAMMLVFSGSTAIKLGTWVMTVPLIIAVLLGALAARSRMRHQQSGHAGSSWHASVPSLLLRSRGVAIRPGLRDTTEILGRVKVSPGELTWTPNRPSARNMGASQMAWALTTAAPVSVRALWGITPMCLLHVADASGAADIWVRGPEAAVTDAIRLAVGAGI